MVRDFIIFRSVIPPTFLMINMITGMVLNIGIFFIIIFQIFAIKILFKIVNKITLFYIYRNAYFLGNKINIFVTKYALLDLFKILIGG